MRTSRPVPRKCSSTLSPTRTPFSVKRPLASTVPLALPDVTVVPAEDEPVVEDDPPAEPTTDPVIVAVPPKGNVGDPLLPHAALMTKSAMGTNNRNRRRMKSLRGSTRLYQQGSFRRRYQAKSPGFLGIAKVGHGVRFSTDVRTFPVRARKFTASQW